MSFEKQFLTLAITAANEKHITAGFCMGLEKFQLIFVKICEVGSLVSI